MVANISSSYKGMEGARSPALHVLWTAASGHKTHPQACHSRGYWIEPAPLLGATRLSKKQKNSVGISSRSRETSPREKLLKKGPQTVSDAELLAILIRVGVPGGSAVNLAKQLLKRFGSLGALSEAPLEELMGVKGLTGAKAAQVAAAREIARRITSAEQVNGFVINDPAQAYLWSLTESARVAAGFDAELANSIAKFESYNKHLYRPNTYLHKWWARRCGSTFRMILKHLVEDEAKRDYYTPGGLEGKIILDPMMGGGTTVHEAIRLGANVIGADIDPIPVLQAKATLSDISLRDLEKAFSVFFEALNSRLSQFFKTQCSFCPNDVDCRFTLYAAKRTCKCGPALFLDSTVLRQESDDTNIEICPETHNISNRGEILKASGSPKPPIKTKGTQSCSMCDEPFKEPTDAPYYARFEPIAIVGECSHHGLFFKPPSERDLALTREADKQRLKLDLGDERDFKIIQGPKSRDLVRRNITSYLDLFSSRQLLYLAEANDILQSIEPGARMSLALLVSTSLEFNCMLCGYKGGAKNRPGAIRHTFSHHAYSFPYTALENNPVNPASVSGTLQNLFRSRIRKGKKWANLPKERYINNGSAETVSIDGEVDYGQEVKRQSALKKDSRRFLMLQGSSVSLKLDSDSVDYVVTDPPYFDSVQYSDLAAFFRVWLKRLLPNEANWDYALKDSAVGQNSRQDIEYADLLGGIFAECHRVLKKDRGRLVFTFHHWNPKAWSALTLALKRGGFVLLERHVVHSENPVSVHISNLKALTHDAILFLAPRECHESSA